MSYLRRRIALLILDGFLAVTALWGALLVVPQLPTSLLRSGPFTDFTVPAFALGSVGILATAGGLAIWWRPPFAAIASIVAGGAVVVFEIVEAAMVGSLLNVPAGLNDRGYVALWLQPFYALVGVGIICLAYVGIYRPWQLRWGATAEELARRMPGDEIVRHPDLQRHPSYNCERPARGHLAVDCPDRVSSRRLLHLRPPR